MEVITVNINLKTEISAGHTSDAFLMMADLDRPNTL